MSDESVSPRTTFDWAIYVDATLAGLAILIPFPLVDIFLEWFFRRRIAKAVAQRNGRRLDPYTLHYVNSEPFSLMGCLLWPISLFWLVLKRLYRTILYFLTIKEATDKLSYYWHRAFLLDYMVRRGDLDSEESSRLAGVALRTVLDQLNTSPFNQLASQVIARVNHVLRAIWHWRRKQEDAGLQAARQEMSQTWAGFTVYLEEAARQYEQTLERLHTEQVAAAIALNAEPQAKVVQPKNSHKSD